MTAPLPAPPVTEPPEVPIPVGEARLAARLHVPRHANGVVVFAHGLGSNRHSPRNTRVARGLWQANLGALLLDLLTAVEQRHEQLGRRVRFDIPEQARRLEGAIDWLSRHAGVGALPAGVFGADTGAAAALTVAAERPDRIRAVVCRGGRPDLAGHVLTRVSAPTLLVVGGQDTRVLELNRTAEELLPGERQLAVVPGATHLFEEPGKLERVTDLATHWFRRHLTPETGHVAATAF